MADFVRMILELARFIKLTHYHFTMRKCKLHKNFGKIGGKFVQDFLKKYLTMVGEYGIIRRWSLDRAPRKIFNLLL
jgi:hypothetical protein